MSEWEEHEEPTDAEIAWLYGQNGRSLPEPDSWTPRNLADLEDAPPVQPTLGGLNLVYPGKRHVFSGPQESAKTLAAYVVGLQVVRSGSRVVLIDFEMGPWDAKTRLRELGGTDDELADILYIDPETPVSTQRVGALLEQDPALVLIDAAAGAFAIEGLDDNSRKDVELWARSWVEPFRRANVATIVLDHVTKNAEARGAYAIGSERKVGGADVHLGFSTVRPISRGDHGLYRVTTHKDRGGFHKRGHLCDFKLVSDPTTHAISWEFVPAAIVDDEHPFRPTIKMEQISRWLEKQAEPVPIGQVEDGVGGNRDAFREAMQLLVQEHYVEETRGPRNARLMTLNRAYREEADDLARPRPTSPEEGGLSDLASSPNPLQGGRGAGEDERATGELAQASGEVDDGIPF